MQLKPRNLIDPADRWQWRTSRTHPSGEWFDSLSPGQPTRAAAQAPTEAPWEGFLTSSYDLLNGLEVSAASPDSIDDFEHLFPGHPLK